VLAVIGADVDESGADRPSRARANLPTRSDATSPVALDSYKASSPLTRRTVTS
jgi:hypothetical protein